MGWLIALGILSLIAVLPVGVRVVYNEYGVTAAVLFGAIRLKLYPKQSEKKKQAEKTEKPNKPAVKKTAVKKENKGGKLSELKPLLELGWHFLGDLRRKLRVKRLDFNLVMAADDPCDLAINYGKAWAAVGNLMPLLEKLFVIKKRNVQVQCDFTADEPRVGVRLDITLTVARILALGAKYAVPAVRELLKLKNTNKGGAI